MARDDIGREAEAIGLYVLGISHRKTPLAIREAFALTPEDVDSLNRRLMAEASISECLILNTCNRVEIYVCATGESASQVIRSVLQSVKSMPEAILDTHLYCYEDLEAIQHLFSVASGLDSQMVGETDILGQLKQAYAAAQEAATTGDRINRLFEKGFQAAKDVRTRTKITRGQVSVGSVTVDLASRIFGKLSDSRVLLIGSGEVSEKTAQALRSRGASDISVSGRTFKKAHQIAQDLHGATIEFEDINDHLHHFDILISSTAAAHPIITSGIARMMMKTRPERPYFIIDLALPRDVEPAVEKVDNVYLYNLDDLSRIANENMAARRSELDQALDIVKRHAWTLWLQLRRRVLAQRLRATKSA